TVRGQRRRLALREDNVVEVHAGRAGDVDLVDQLKAKDAQGKPWQVQVVADGKADGKGRELGANGSPRVERSRDEHVDIVVAEPLDAERLGRDLPVAGHAVAEAPDTEAFPVERADVEPVELVGIAEMLTLES